MRSLSRRQKTALLESSEYGREEEGQKKERKKERKAKGLARE
jgi:hypothetical protein